MSNRKLKIKRKHTNRGFGLLLFADELLYFAENERLRGKEQNTEVGGK